MRPVLTVRGIGLRAEGPTLTTRLGSGQSLAVLGPAASGKSRLLRVLAGDERPAVGKVELLEQSVWAGVEGASRRTTPLALAKRCAGPKGTGRATEALADCGLWDARSKALSELSPGQLAATELLPIVLAPPSLLVVDGALDRLDPWTFENVWKAIRRRLEQGGALLVATHRTDRLHLFSSVVVLRAQQVRFFGTLEALVRLAGPTEIVIETQHDAEVRALVEPFEATVRATEQGLVVQVGEGQELAARLLLEGYGNARVVMVREATADEALRRL
ncbi:MAG: ATP-binding cassette domain-containing protein [Chthonomonadaceae bacterium]|nr:ATP-binding cassette domain-containing protein [Chthonomonadaceae bacterium]